MDYSFTKMEIDRLGEKIRFQINTDNEILKYLQAYRISHHSDLSQIFNLLCNHTRRIHSTAITTFRTKRIESIINKLGRYPEMRFSRMWDIAGCRCILKTQDDVYRLKKMIELDKELIIIKEKDYIKNPQDSGYRSLHLFIKRKSSSKIIEVQIRNIEMHNWATLVEISDLLFSSQLKEYGTNKELLNFHYLLSRQSNLNINEKQFIVDTLKKNQYFERLSEVFSRNYINVRRQWVALEDKYNHKFFLIDVSKEGVPKIKSYPHFHEAEKEYFSLYKNQNSHSTFLTYLQKPDYKQISIAYSNYILTFHSFLFESLNIMESLISDSLASKKIGTFRKNLLLYDNLIFLHIKNLKKEAEELNNHSLSISHNKHIAKKKAKEWVRDINNQIDQFKNRSTKISSIIYQMPSNFFTKALMRIIIGQLKRRRSKNIKLLS